MYSCWQLKLHTSLRSSQIDLFVSGDHSESRVVLDSELKGIRPQTAFRSLILLFIDGQIKGGAGRVVW
jgi:hypothetical protein